MRLKTAVIAGLLVAVLGGAAALLAEEKEETVLAPDAAANGEWIESVPGQSAQFWAVGDADPPRSARVARLIRRADPDRILYLGDVYPHGTRGDFRRWAKPFGGLVRRMAPTPGNHEWGRASEGYEPFWRRITGERPPEHYAFEARGWEILAANSETDDPGPIARRLSERANAGGDCRIAFWHRPRYSAGKKKGGDERAVRYWEALEGGARIVLNGHDHNSQRLLMRDGIVQFIAGAGGRHLYDVDENDRRLAFSDDTHYGALRLDLSPGEARWRFVTARGLVLDAGSLRCRA